jgi:hypothetical protein
VAPFEEAEHEETTTPAKRLRVRLAARIAVDAAVKHAADEAKPIDATVVVDMMNLLMSRDRMTNLRNLTSTMTYRGSFPVRGYPLLELPTGVVESFAAGRWAWLVSFRCICRAFDLHSRRDA